LTTAGNQAWLQLVHALGPLAAASREQHRLKGYLASSAENEQVVKLRNASGEALARALDRAKTGGRPPRAGDAKASERSAKQANKGDLEVHEVAAQKSWLGRVQPGSGKAEVRGPSTLRGSGLASEKGRRASASEVTALT